MTSKANMLSIGIATGLALTAMSLGAGFANLGFVSWFWFVILSSVVSGALVYLTAWLWRYWNVPRWCIPVIFFLGIVFRLCAMQAPHMMCDDAARYHWDGKLIAHSMNPYSHPPNSLALIEMKNDGLDEVINHGNVRTPYPPLAELLFAAGYLLSPGSLTGFQALSLCAEFATWILLFLYLKKRNKPLVTLLFAAWLPLAITEGYLPGHADLLGLPFLTLFLISVEQKKPKLAGIAFAAACAIKPLIIIFAPAAIRELSPRKSVTATAMAAAILSVLYLPSMLTGKSHFGPMMEMARNWDCNGTISTLLEYAMPLESARIAAAFLLFAAIIFSAWWGRDFISRCALAIAAIMALSPVVFPWYLVWIIPLVVLRPDPALLALLLLVPLTSVVQIDLYLTGVWYQPPWSVTAAFLPFYFLLVVGAWRKWGMFATN